jgi:hypothetical protein
MITTPQPLTLLHLVVRYFKFEQRTSLFLIIAGLVFFFTGLYMAFVEKVSPYYRGIGDGLAIMGWLTCLNSLLINPKSKWHYVAVCQALAGKVLQSDEPDPGVYAGKMQHCEKQRLWLSLLSVLLLLLLHGAGFFRAGFVHALLGVNTLHLICNELRCYWFNHYWNVVHREINKHKIDCQLKEAVLPGHL